MKKRVHKNFEIYFSCLVWLHAYPAKLAKDSSSCLNGDVLRLLDHLTICTRYSTRKLECDNFEKKEKSFSI